MPKKFHWDLVRVIAISGGILGIIIGILMILHIWGPIGGFLAPDFISLLIEIIICGIIIIGWGILGWDIWEVRYSFLTFIVVGLVLIILFGNLAGILLVIAAIPIPFGS
jgi:hypothetical protein